VGAVRPVRTLHRETATWDSAKEDWGPPEWPQEADFTAAGRLAELREYGGDGSVTRTNWTYDGAGRVVEVTRSSAAWSGKWRRLYDMKAGLCAPSKWHLTELNKSRRPGAR
jgi:YD repeat-containing protein